jgi:hypothetical protein
MVMLVFLCGLGLAAWSLLRQLADYGVGREVVSVVPSPSDKADAVVVETNGGATTSYGYEVHIVPHGATPDRGQEAAYLYGAIGKENRYGVKVRWDGPSRVVVEYLAAKTASVSRPSTVVGGERVAVVLEAGASQRKSSQP